LNGIIFAKDFFEDIIINENALDDLKMILTCAKDIKKYFDQNNIVVTTNIAPVFFFSALKPLKYTIGIIDNMEKYNQLINHAKLRML